MERPLWDRIQEIYHSALPIPRSERSAFLAAACGDDPLLLREIIALLEADDAPAGFLDSPVFEVGLRVMSNGQNSSNGNGSAPEKSLVGTMVGGKYLVEQELSEGGMGKVYLASDTTLHQRRVVIKVLLEAKLEDPYMMKNVRREVVALARIDHPNIVSVFETAELPDHRPYIVMQYVDGVTLRSQIPREGMNLDRAALILKQLGAALADVHELGILHRDLKPENIMLQVRGGAELVKVVDFGIAKVKDSIVAASSTNSATVGTVRYMSPEQLRSEKSITAASDIYSMAIVAFEMITGRRPFNPSSGPQLLELQREGVKVNPIDLRPTLPSEARAILLHALSFDPAARYQSAAEFGDCLARALAQNPKPVPAVQPVDLELQNEPSAPPNKKLANFVAALTKGRRKIVLAGVVIALIGVAVALYVSSQQRIADQIQPLITEPAPTPTSLRTFTYSLDVQKMRNGKPYQEPFRSSGKNTFETGYRFRLNVSSPDPGYLYLFNEGPSSQSGSTFTILYPTPLTNQGQATLGANQVVQTNWNIFAGQTGIEKFWIVWSISKVPELEAAMIEAFLHPKGALTGASFVATRNFLTMKDKEIKTRYTTNKETDQTTVRGSGDLLIRLVEFEHR